MLTKEEREAIAERLSSVTELGDRTFYEAITGKQRPHTTSYEEDLKAMFNVIIDLCDTSNMIELPVDKDGEAIHIGDTLYDDDNTEFKVIGYVANENSLNIILNADKKSVNIVAHAETLTHKKLVTIASLAKELADIVSADYGTPMVVKHKISDIAEQLESLGDSND